MEFGKKVKETPKRIIGIYLIRCNTNNKVYIGKSNNIRKRIRQHKSNLERNIHRNIHLQRSYNLYGKENFKYYILQETNNVGELIKLEEKWIKKFNSTNFDHGFNMMLPGETPYGEQNGSSIVTEEEVKEIISEFYNRKTNTEIADSFGISTSIVSSIRTRDAWRAVYPSIKTFPSSPSNYKLTPGDVARIKNLLSRNIATREQICEEYDIGTSHLGGIITGRVWSDILPNIKIPSAPEDPRRPMAILSEEEVAKIKIKIIENEMSLDELAREYNISRGAIGHIKNGSCWAHILPDLDTSEYTHKGYKLSKEDVIKIKKRIAKGDPKKDIARDFDVSSSLISSIHSGNRHKNVGVNIKLPEAQEKNILDIEKVKEIKKALKNGMETWEVAEKFNEKRQKIWRIKTGRTWSDVKI